MLPLILENQKGGQQKSNQAQSKQRKLQSQQKKGTQSKHI